MTHEQLILSTVKLLVNCEGEEGFYTVGEGENLIKRAAEKFHFPSIVNRVIIWNAELIKILRQGSLSLVDR